MSPHTHPAQSITALAHIDVLRKKSAADFMVKLYQMLSHENQQLIAWQDGERRAARTHTVRHTVRTNSSRTNFFFYVLRKMRSLLCYPL